MPLKGGAGIKTRAGRRRNVKTRDPTIGLNFGGNPHPNSTPDESRDPKSLPVLVHRYAVRRYNEMVNLFLRPG